MVAALGGAAAPGAASAAPRAEVCASRAAVLDTPGGLAVGVLYRGDRVRVVRRDRTGRWVRIRSAAPVIGWLRGKALC